MDQQRIAELHWLLELSRGSSELAEKANQRIGHVVYRWSRLDLLLQRLAFEEGHGNEGLAFDFIDLVDVADVGVIECGGRFCLSPETGLDLFVPEQVGG